MPKQSKDEKKAAVQEYKAAREDLARTSRKSKEETPEYYAANDRVAKAEKNVPWYRQL